MRRLWKLFVALLVATGLVVGVTACSSPASIDMAKVTTVVDVRTPAEFAAGHLHGAVNMDVQSATFASQVSKLDKNGTYVVYCKSGNRSTQAINQMKAMGFTNLINGGGLADAGQATGLPTVK